ncbi:hypothetical protein GCM10028895_10320 [Pontibacter rugosus]
MNIEVEGECSLDVYKNLIDLFDIKDTKDGSTSSSFSIASNKIDLTVIF